ncbi:helix-turn-helix domain-containing protein [Dyadobacter sp. CY323]|uniref:helix-turn-helix domain-containing protein n=1 Tax=Dyadobacter sp. CY323 TaxID=2907302 RepID=UPI001F173E0E|nr:helix-turn-helix domain-containing protein [Dyadobacter sp. CY323]MCE6992077.1 helix-turn-helix domain-containing protein [Dyadobacter sp. CY323]
MDNPFDTILSRLDRFEAKIDAAIKEKFDKNGVDTEEYFTVTKTAAFLDCSEPHVYELKKRIPHIIRGARLYFKKTDLVRYLESGRVGPNKSRI